MWLTLLFGALAAIFVALTLSTLSHQRWARRLPPLDALPGPHPHGDAGTALPRCSVVIAARDEAARIERVIRPERQRQKQVRQHDQTAENNHERTGDVGTHVSKRH